MTPAKCLKLFGQRHLTEYEKTEILDFPQVYYFGEGVKKIQSTHPRVSSIVSCRLLCRSENPDARVIEAALMAFV